MKETEVEEYEGQGEEGELEASCDIVSVRSWRGVRARGGTFCTEPAHRDTAVNGSRQTPKQSQRHLPCSNDH